MSHQEQKGRSRHAVLAAATRKPASDHERCSVNGVAISVTLCIGGGRVVATSIERAYRTYP